MFLFFNNSTSSESERNGPYQRVRTLLGDGVIQKLNALHKGALNTGLVNDSDLLEAYRRTRCVDERQSDRNNVNIRYTLAVVAFILIATPVFIEILTLMFGTHCFVPNNSLVWEATRPISDCQFCIGVNGPLILRNMTREKLSAFAYNPRPIIIKKAVTDWPASRVLNFKYLKELYERMPGALSEKCPVSTFTSHELKDLRDIFQMSPERIDHGEPPWYVGWSACHANVSEEIRKLYPRPHFLPIDAEMSNTIYLYMGYEQGARMHLDYMPRLLWQAQLQGSNTWILAPTPECDTMCKPFSFYVETGDALLVDTRNWYHGTFVPKGEFALTMQSEYG